MADSDREAVNYNRKHGVCLRCKLNKEQCRDGIPCDRCRSLGRWSDICVPVRFESNNVFDRDIYYSRVTALLENVHSWPSGPQHSQAENDVAIEVCNGYTPKLRLKVDRFESKNDALLEHVIWRGTERPTYNLHPSTPYGLKHEPDLDEYLDQHAPYFLEDEANRIDLPLVSIYAATLKAAYTYSQSEKPLSSLVRKAIRIWIAQTFLFQNVWRLQGNNLLGMSPIYDLNGIIPLPRLINQQLDFYLEKKVAALEKEVLAELQKHITEHKGPNWFGTYLTIYVFLCSLERDLWSLNTWENDTDILKERTRELAINNPKVTVWPINDRPSDLAEKNRHLSCMLVCLLKGVSKGYIPFKLDWDTKKIMEMVDKDVEAINYMRNMSSQVAQYRPYLLERQKAQYSRNDSRSYIAKFTSQIMTESAASAC